MLTDLLADLSRLGVQVWAENGQLRYRAPARTLTDELRAELARHKTDLLALFQQEGGRRSTVLEHVPLPDLVPRPHQRHEPFPLTDIQQAYWIGRGSGFELGNVATHAYFEFERADLDVERLNGAWQQLIARHDMLRAVVNADGQQQVLEDASRYAIGVTDLRNAAELDVRAQVDAVRERMAHQVYDPAQWPLFEVRATRLPGGQVRVHVSIDLLMADVWSLFILFREWGALYEEPSRSLPRLTMSFRDYVLLDAAIQATPQYARAQAYWTARLPALRPGPDLPLARPPASIAKPRFVRRSSRIEPVVWRRVKQRARQHGLTPSMVLCALFSEVLAAWSTDAGFTLNLTLFHRLPLHADVNAVVGDFTSTVLLAHDAADTANVIERGRGLQQQLWNDLEHRHVSGVRVLRDFTQRAGGGQRLAMPVVFTSTLGHEVAGTAAASAWLGELIYGISQTPQVWLDHQVGEDGDALVFNWDAVEALFPAGLLDEMFSTYLTRLTSLGIDDGAWIAAPTTRRPDAVGASAPHHVVSSTHDTSAVGRAAAAASASRPTFVAPRDDIERQLAGIWEDVLGVHRVGVTDRFFDLGGNSFLAARLMIRVQQRFGRRLSVSSLLHADDIEGLARLIREQPSASTSTLVHLAAGARPAFFCVHPIGGNVVCYIDLARRLGNTRAFCGLHAAGLQGETAPFQDLAMMAAFYLDQIRAVQPRGPYLLGGWSLGGTIAFEMAQQLRAQEEVTARLVLIDTETTAVADATGRAVVGEQDPVDQIPPDADPEHVRHLLAVIAHNHRALRAYRERPYPGSLTLLRAREQPDGRPHDLGWNAVAAGGVDVHVVPGDHYTILQPPNVDALAVQLGLCLEGASV